MKECVLCTPDLVPNQVVVLSNEHCLFLQLEQSKVIGSQLEGAGLMFLNRIGKLHLT